MKLLLKKGKIYQERNVFTDALYIENGYILSAGRNALLHEPALSPSEIMDLEGKTVVPGFNDAHLHFYQAGLALSTVNLYGSTSIEEMIRRSISFLENHGETLKTLSGRGFNQDYFEEKRLPLRSDLDRISETIPIVFTRTCSHLAVVNSAALKKLDLSMPLPHIEGGQIDVDTDGAPNGIFRENAIRLLDVLYEEESVDSALHHIRAAAEKALSYGLTSVQVNDIWLENPESEVVEEAYRRFAEENPSIRVYHQVYAKDLPALEKRLKSGFDRSESPFLRYGLLKMFADGSLGARTAYLRKPYADDPSTRGIPTMSQDLLESMIRKAEDNGIQTAIHVIGDGALERVLDAYEKVIQDNRNRHGLIHVQITDPDLLDRIRKLNLMVYAQPIFLHYDLHIVEDRVGKTLAATSYAFATMEKLGIKVAYSSDAPIENFHVMENLHCAVNRQDLTLFPEKGYNMKEAVDRFTALDNITVNSAYMSHEENRKGRLLPGYYADLVVLKEPYFDVDKDRIKDIQVDMTMVNGQIRYDSRIDSIE
ncbi:amidohydrolase [Proteiniclasticum sp. C24MP]|uniref:amidohydrolase n=1 Tax=Proteiniclasticum sp. C24MP TaxID=3374101 RepID=UPI0037550FD6